MFRMKTNNSRSSSRRVVGIKRRIGVAYWILLTSTTAIVRCTTATAFSLTSLFPRKITEKVQHDNKKDLLVENNNIPKTTTSTRDEDGEAQKNGMMIQRDTQLAFSEGHTLIPEGLSDQPDQLPYQIISDDMRQEEMNNREVAWNGSPHEEDSHSSNSFSTTTTTASGSVHMQLQTMHQATSISRTTTQALQQQQPHTVPAASDDTNGLTPAAAPATVADQSSGSSKLTQVRVHSYLDAATNRTWMALNTSRRKFVAFLECNNVILSSTLNIQQQIISSIVHLPEQQQRSHSKKEGGGGDTVECAIRNEWRELWKAQQLITDRTELLAVYQSDNDDDDEDEEEEHGSNSRNAKDGPQRRRGGFRDLLNLYANRLVAILQDEQYDERTPPASRYHESLVRSHQTNRYGQPLTDESFLQQNDHRILVKWLEDHYGMSETLMLQASRFRSLPVPAQLELMQHFLEWFRGHFPYYYDRCDSCGSSQKDDLASHQQQQAQEGMEDINGEVDDDDNDEDDDDDNSTFLGYIYPDPYEVKGKASRTELYQCHKCGSFTRFPRYNSAFDIIQSRRGRCGEYSLLLYRFLRALNHDARWVVDWADHVWAEVKIGGDNHTGCTVAVGGAKTGILNDDQSATTSNKNCPRWVHLDPCEAAVDKPLLYEEWGKKQTYIIALYAPLRYQALQVQRRNNGFFLGHLSRLHNGGSTNSNNGAHFVDKTSSLVEDVTQQYTSDSWEDICKRREESDEEVDSAVRDAIQALERQLF